MKKITLFLALSLLVNFAFSQQKLPDDITESIKKRIEYGHTLSIVVGIIDKDGQKEAAIVNYKKTLELNPANSNATDMLTRMGAAEPSK